MLIINFRILIVLFVSFQCSTPKEKEVEFEMLNKEIYFPAIFVDEGGTFPWGIYDDYRTQEDKQKGKNIIRYKVKNNLSHNILFIPNSDEMAFLTKEDIKNNFPIGLSYSIPNLYDKRAEFVRTGKTSKKWEDFERNYRMDSIAFAQDTIQYQSIYDRRRFKNFMYLKPNETKVFEIRLNLPIVVESNKIPNFGVDVLPLFKDVEYQFQLHYIQNKKQLEKELPKQIIDYLNENGIKIVDLSLHSQTIKLIGR